MVDVGAHTESGDDLAQGFVQFAVESGVLRFGEFKTKAGRLSPYFFNAGLFDDGRKLGRLAEFYAKALLASGIEFDMVFGPAYKGIPLAATVAVELASSHHTVASVICVSFVLSWPHFGRYAAKRKNPVT